MTSSQGGPNPKQFWEANAAGHHASLASLLSTPGGGVLKTPKGNAPEGRSMPHGQAEGTESLMESKGMGGGRSGGGGLASIVSRVVESPAAAFAGGSSGGSRVPFGGGASDAHVHEDTKSPEGKGSDGDGDDDTRPLLS